MKKKQSDYFEASINVNGKSVSKISGTYLGWIDIDGMRYYDYRHCMPFELQVEKAPLYSDSQYRLDIATLDFSTQ